jgi:hypothetical protein
MRHISDLRDMIDERFKRFYAGDLEDELTEIRELLEDIKDELESKPAEASTAFPTDKLADPELPPL